MPHSGGISGVPSSQIDEDHHHSASSKKMNSFDHNTKIPISDTSAKKTEEQRGTKMESSNPRPTPLPNDYSCTMSEAAHQHQVRVEELMQNLLHEVNTLQNYIPLDRLSSHQREEVDKARSLVQFAAAEVERQVAKENKGRILETVFLLGQISGAEKQLENAVRPPHHDFVERDEEIEVEQPRRPRSPVQPDYYEHLYVSDGSRYDSPLAGFERPGRVSTDFGRQPDFSEWLVVGHDGDDDEKYKCEQAEAHTKDREPDRAPDSPEDGADKPHLLSVTRLATTIRHALFFWLVWFTQTVMGLSWNVLIEQFMAWWQALPVVLYWPIQGCLYRVKRLGFKFKRWDLSQRTMPRLPKHTKHILVAHCSVLLNIACCMVWLHRLDELLQANGHSRRQMLDYLYDGDECLVYRPNIDYMSEIISGFNVVVRYAGLVTGEVRELGYPLSILAYWSRS